MDKKTAQTKVKVIVRVRPQLKPESKTCLNADGNNIHIVNYRNKTESLQYEFCSVYNESSTQQTIFTECVYPMLQNAFEGQNISVFAYGPTGAGKTHTMLGVLSDPGIIPRTVQSLFKMISDEVNESTTNQSKPQHTVTFSYLEIYNEKVQDLLKAGNSDLPIREDASHNIFVAGLTEKTIQNFDDFKNSFGPASSNRTVAATKLNEASSRSHSILMLKVTRRAQGKVYRGKVYLIDLAGSEDNRRTGNKGIRMKESAAINKSLFVLGEVVDAINHNQIRIPYRNSKLTRLLQDSIGGSCHSIMITNIAPEQHYYYDSYCTLNFATKSKKIVNVNTASVKSNISVETQPVKPTAQLQPTKRRSESFQHPSQPKKSRAASVSAEVSNELIVLPSPILRRQAEFENEVNAKLNMLMERVQHSEDLAAVKKLKDEVTQGLSTAVKPKLSSSCSTPSLGTRRRTFSVPKERRKSSRLNSAVSETESFLQIDSNSQPSSTLESNINKAVASMNKINACRGSSCSSSQEFITPPDKGFSSSTIIDPTPQPEKRGLQDKTNILYQHYMKGKGKRTKAPTCKILLDDDPDETLLFFKEKKKKSVAEPPKEKKIKNSAFKFINDDQFERNTEFLKILNTASIKELQKLQKIGEKRAQIIHDFREMHGGFNFVDELSKIPGFTDNFVKSLLKANLLLDTDEKVLE